jgi:hypothetical protein
MGYVSLMFVNSIENGIVDIDITVIEMDVSQATVW